MEAVIKEIMELVDAYGDYCETFGDYQVAANAQECVKAKAAIESHLRQALQCQGCDVPAGGVHQISEPASKAQQTAPRGKSWRNWELVDSPIGFPTYDSMVQYHCNPERVRELEEGRDMRMQTIDRLQAEIARLEGLLAAALPVAQQGVQPPFMYAIADGHGQPFFEEEGCVSSEAKDLQPEVDSLNETLDGEPPYKVVALYTHPTPQGLAAQQLHGEIMNLPCAKHIGLSYREGHRDARHAAAELVLAAQAKQEAGPLLRCASDRDGDCTHAQCPQLRDSEPGATGRHCPLDVDQAKQGEQA